MSRSGSSQTPEDMDAMFVGWTPGAEKEVRKTAPRLHHKKSRTGCQQCRARRVKVRRSLSFSRVASSNLKPLSPKEPQSLVPFSWTEIG